MRAYYPTLNLWSCNAFVLTTFSDQPKSASRCFRLILIIITYHAGNTYWMTNRFTTTALLVSAVHLGAPAVALPSPHRAFQPPPRIPVMPTTTPGVSLEVPMVFVPK